MSRRPLFALILAGSFACSTRVDPSHPLDPATPPTQQARASISGAIFAGGAPLAGADVTLRKNSVPVKQAHASADGTFLLDGLEPGTFVFECTPPGYVGLQRLVQLGAGDRLDLGVLVATPLAATAAIVGRATLAGEGSFGGILVEAVGRAYTTVTDSAGAFRLQVPAGRFDLRLSRAGFITQTVDGVTVQTGEERVLDAVGLAANPATVAGHVDAEVAGGGTAPLSNATVTLDGTAVTGLTGATGDFQLTGVPPGSYVLRVVKSGYVGASAPVLNLMGGVTHTLEEPVRLALERGALAGRVTLADTADASGILVEVTGTPYVAITPSDGSFSLAGLLGGTYGVAARRDGYAPRDLGTYTVTSGVVTQVTAAVLARQSSTVTVLEGPYTRTRTIHLSFVASGATGFHVSEDPAFADPTLGDVAASPWRPYGAASVAFTLADLDGRHGVYVAVTDGTSVLGVFPATVVLDRAAPQGPSLVVGDGSGFSRAPGGVVALALAAQDLPTRPGAEVSGVATMHLTNDPGRATWTEVSYATTWSWTVADPGVDGTKWISVRFVDRAGNVGPWIAASVVLDTVAPSSPAISLAGPAPAAPGTTLSPIVNATLSATDANGGAGGVGLQVRISNTPGFEGARYQPFLPATSWILPPGDGTKTVYAQFMDRAGNESLPVSASIRLDTTGPTGASVAIVEQDTRPTNGFTNVATVTLVLSAAGEPVTAQASEDPGFGAGATTSVDLVGKTLPLQAPFTFAGVGARTVWVRFLDAAGNAGSATLAGVTIDTVAPSPVPPTLSAAVTPTAAIRITPPDAGQDELRIAGDHTGAQDTWSPAPAGVSIPVTLTPGDGVKALTVTWRDRADNVSAPIPLAVTLDGTPPSVAGAFTIRGTLGDGSSSTTSAASGAVTLGLATAASDAGSGIAAVKISNLDTLADASWQPWVATSVAWTLAPGDGAKRVYARFRDAAGNDSAVVSGTITLAATPPSGGTLVVASGATVTNLSSVPLAISAVGAAEMQVSVNGTGAGWIPYATAGTATLADPEGQKVVAVRFRNAARVEGGGTSTSIAYDHTPPAAPALALQGVLGDGRASSVWTTRSAITVSFALPGDASLAEMALVESATCTFPASPFWQPVAPATTFVLSGGDGQKTVCARFRDRAGNVGPAASAAINLDTIAPTNPAFADLATDVTNATTVSGQLVTASVDPAPGTTVVAYQCYASPAAPAWTDCAPGSGNVFTFALTANAPNVVGVRARDDAWNVSAGTLVSVVQDGVAPLAPRITGLRTRGDTLTVSWAAPPDVDVASYDVFYGTASGDVSGSGAAQGDSPIHVAASASAQSLTLTGLTTGTTYYVALRATDRAGNRSGLSGQRSGTPDVVNPRVLSTIGGKVLALGVRTAPAATYGYFVQSQGIVQVSLSAGNAEPTVVARAWLPGFLPAPAHDGASAYSTQLALFDCTHPRTGDAGHCLVVAGAEFRDPNGTYPAWTSPPIVYFPVSGSGDPLTAGEVLGALPGRPMRVVHTTVSGRPLALAAEADAVRVYDLTRPDFPRLVATAAYPKPLQKTLQAGVTAGVLAVWGQFGTTTLATELHEFDLTSVLAGTLVDRRQTVLLDHLGVALDPGSGLSIGSEGVFAVYSSTRVASYALGQGAPTRSAVIATDARGCEPSGTTAGHLWVFCREPTTTPPRPGPRMFGLTTSTLAVFATSASLAEGSQELHGTAAVYATQSPSGSAEHVLTLLYQYVNSVYDDWVVRWRYAAGTLTQESGDWRDVRPTEFALWEDFAITVRGSALEVVDLSNPLRPRRVYRYSGAATSYQKLVVHGSRLFAATDRSGTPYLEAFQLYRDGSIGYLGALASQRTIADMVVRGRYLVAARQLEGLTVYDVNGTAPVLVNNYFAVSTSFDAVDARIQSRGGVFYPLIVYAVVSGGVQTFTFDGAVLAPLSARVALANSPSSITVSGSYAAVAGMTSTSRLSISDPMYPSAYSTVYPLQGPVLFQGGYLVGTGFHGPAFHLVSTGEGHGKLVNSGCRYGNLVSADGLYLVACGDNGIALVSAVSPESARLVKRFDLSGGWQDSGALVTDGSTSFFGGAGDGRQLYSVDEQTNASGAAPAQPYGNTNNVLASGRYAKFALAWDGLTLVFTAGDYVSTSIEAYETNVPTGTWPLRFSQPFVSTLGDMPATDGETLWVTTGGSVQAYDLRRAGTGTFPVVATGSAPATLSLDVLARSRQRVYATGYSSSGDSTVLVWDTSGGGLAARTAVTLATGARYLYGLAVRGGYLFYAFKRLGVPGAWLGVVQLGASGDGAGAVDLGTIDISTFSDWISLTGVGLTVSGDVLNASIGGSWLTFDLAPLWQRGELPVFGAWSGAIDRPWSLGQPRTFVDGPFGYVGGPTYRVFDLR